MLYYCIFESVVSIYWRVAVSFTQFFKNFVMVFLFVVKEIENNFFFFSKAMNHIKANKLKKKVKKRQYFYL